MAIPKRTCFEVLRRDNHTAYFAAICWKRLRAMQEIAEQIVAGDDAP